MKIAVVSEDEVTISQHFGRAPFYVVFTVENGTIKGKETRVKSGHHATGANHVVQAPGQPHGFDAASQATHAGMAETIADCSVLIAGGMGQGAYQSLQGFNIETVMTDAQNIDQAVRLYVQGKLPNRTERLH
jgi:predicted Fe-Mo cluster-binding NifX family protein